MSSCQNEKAKLVDNLLVKIAFLTTDNKIDKNDLPDENNPE